MSQIINLPSITANELLQMSTAVLNNLTFDRPTIFPIKYNITINHSDVSHSKRYAFEAAVLIATGMWFLDIIDWPAFLSMMTCGKANFHIKTIRRFHFWIFTDEYQKHVYTNKIWKLQFICILGFNIYIVKARFSPLYCRI